MKVLVTEGKEAPRVTRGRLIVGEQWTNERRAVMPIATVRSILEAKALPLCALSRVQEAVKRALLAYQNAGWEGPIYVYHFPRNNLDGGALAFALTCAILELCPPPYDPLVFLSDVMSEIAR